MLHLLHTPSRHEPPRAAPRAALVRLPVPHHGGIGGEQGGPRCALFLDRFRANDLPYVDIAIAVHRRRRRRHLHPGRGRLTNLRNLQVGSLVAFAVHALAFWWLVHGRASGGRAVRRHLHLGGRALGAGAGAGLDAGQLRHDHARGQARVRPSSAAAPFWAGSSAASRPRASAVAVRHREHAAGLRTLVPVVCAGSSGRSGATGRHRSATSTPGGRAKGGHRHRSGQPHPRLAISDGDRARSSGCRRSSRPSRAGSSRPSPRPTSRTPTSWRCSSARSTWWPGCVARAPGAAHRPRCAAPAASA